MFNTKFLFKSHAVKSSTDAEVIEKRGATVIDDSPLDGIAVLPDHKPEIAVQACQIMLQSVGIALAEGADMRQQPLQFPKDVYQSAYRPVGDIHSVHLDNGSYEIHALGHVLNILFVVVHLQVELFTKKNICLVAQHEHILLASAHHGEVVYETFVSRAYRHAKSYHILVEERHIEVGQQLRGDIPDGHTSEPFCEEQRLVP